ncbi:MAG: hypothetical protein NVS2B1_16510 [Bradyrhizobium sp.]
MKIYSIVSTGDCYVVRAGEKSILKVASRRLAARLVAEAAELLSTGFAAGIAGAGRSINRL